MIYGSTLITDSPYSVLVVNDVLCCTTTRIFKVSSKNNVSSSCSTPVSQSYTPECFRSENVVTLERIWKLYFVKTPTQQKTSKPETTLQWRTVALSSSSASWDLGSYKRMVNSHVKGGYDFTHWFIPECMYFRHHKVEFYEIHRG